MKDTVIREPAGGLVIVENEDSKYELHHDSVTGDWQVISDDDPKAQGQWMKTRKDAVKYALRWSGALENAQYNHAPDRTSA